MSLKIENLEKIAPRFLYESYGISYKDSLLKSGFSSIKNFSKQFV